MKSEDLTLTVRLDIGEPEYSPERGAWICLYRLRLGDVRMGISGERITKVMVKSEGLPEAGPDGALVQLLETAVRADAREQLIRFMVEGLNRPTL